MSMLWIYNSHPEAMATSNMLRLCEALNISQIKSSLSRGLFGDFLLFSKHFSYTIISRTTLSGMEQSDL